MTFVTFVMSQTPGARHQFFVQARSCSRQFRHPPQSASHAPPPQRRDTSAWSRSCRPGSTDIVYWLHRGRMQSRPASCVRAAGPHGYLHPEQDRSGGCAERWRTRRSDGRRCPWNRNSARKHDQRNEHLLRAQAAVDSDLQVPVFAGNPVVDGKIPVHDQRVMADPLAQPRMRRA